ncbi:MAG TPA: hypothetical protein V6D08_20965 [Candidatus Obscuribacterales bacterium]
MALKEAYQQRFEAQLREWEAEFAKWKARAEKETAEVKIQYYKQMEGLEPKLRAAQEKLDELKQASGEAWMELQVGLEKAFAEAQTAFSDLKEAWQKAMSKFQKPTGTRS